MKKPNGKVLTIYAAVLGALTLLVGILSICDSARTNCGSFINSIIAAALFFALAYVSSKNDTKKSSILVFVLIADFILSAFGNGIQDFINCGDLGKIGVGGIMIATLVFDGLGYLALFAGAGAVLYLSLSEKANKENCNFLSGSAFFIAAILFFIAAILTLCNGGNGLSLVTSFLSNLLIAGQAVFFAFKSFELSK